MSAFAGMTEGGNYSPAPEGTHGARLYQAIDLGTQEDIYGTKRKILVIFELPSKLMDDGRPYTIGTWYASSLHRMGNLRGDLTSWLGRVLTRDEVDGFSWKIVADIPCLVTITHKTNDNGDVKAKVQSITAVPEGMEVKPLSGEQLILDLDKFSKEVFSKLPEGITAIVQKSPQYQVIASKLEPDPDSSPGSGALKAIK